MSGSRLPLGGTASYEIVRAKQVGLLVSLNGTRSPVMIAVGETRVVNLGTFPVEIEVVEIAEPKPPTPSRFRFVGPTGVNQTVLAIDEAEAWRLFIQRNGPMDNITISEVSL